MRNVFKQAVKDRSDRLMNFFLPGFFLMGLGLAWFYDTWGIAIGVGGLCLAAYYTVKRALPDSDLYQYVLSTILGVFMAQYIYQMHGLFEMHFFAFIGSAILITYQNWKLQIPMLVVVLLHHGIFGYLQNIGFDKIYFTQLNYFELRTFVIHIFFSAIIFFTCGLWSYQLNKYSEIQVAQAMEMGKMQQEAALTIETHKRELERQAEVLEKAVAQGKFEMAADILHDIGNAVVGFGSYLTRVQRMLDHDPLDKIQKLSGFFKTERAALITAIGEAKADAVTVLLDSVGRIQGEHRQELEGSLTEQLGIVKNIQGILEIQRQYMSGRDGQERKPVNLRDLVGDCLSMLGSAIRKKAIDISVDCPDGLPLLKGDRTKLMYVMLNLLKNSIDATGLQSAGKTIVISLSLEGKAMLLRVRDSGCGFGEDTESRLFERGFTTKSAGAGLGLYNCRTIAESHEGTLSVVSDGPGRGALATLSLFLPVN